MTYIITEPCVGVCDTACVAVCPVDCIHYTKDDAGAEITTKKDAGESIEGLQLFINPEECIDCGACVPECPVEAIFEEDDTPDNWSSFIALNYEHFGLDAP